MWFVLADDHAPLSHAAKVSSNMVSASIADGSTKNDIAGESKVMQSSATSALLRVHASSSDAVGFDSEVFVSPLTEHFTRQTHGEQGIAQKNNHMTTPHIERRNTTQHADKRTSPPSISRPIWSHFMASHLDIAPHLIHTNLRLTFPHRQITPRIKSGCTTSHCLTTCLP